MLVRKFVISYFLIVAILSAYAQESRRLTTDWEFVKHDLGGVWEAVRPFNPGSPESVPIWSTVILPHCYNALDAVDPDVNYYQGPAWYRTQLRLHNPYENGRVLLHFEGAGQKTEVYIYTTKVGEHVGGYDEWTVDITAAVDAFKATSVYKEQFKGKIPVSIRTDNSRDLELIPSDMSDFNVYGGLYRHVNLVYTPQLAIDKVFADAAVDEGGRRGTVKIRTRFRNPDGLRQATVNVRLSDHGGQEVASLRQLVELGSTDQEIGELTVAMPTLWHPDSPQLYALTVQVIADNINYTHQQKIGFRYFQFVDKGPFKLNGKRLLLRGTHRHEDHAGVGAAMTDEQILEEMVMMKAMGVNFIRLGHYQQSRIVLNACDSLGILVWEEIPWCRGGLGGDAYQRQAKRMLTNMIEQHYNHPSVIIWGVGNENDWPGDFTVFEQEAIREFMNELNDLSHRLDPSRKTAIRRCDFCKDIVDVYSPSIWAGWYRGIYTDYKHVSRKEFERVPHFLHVEWGGDSHARRHAENPDNGLEAIASGNSADERLGDASLFGGAARASKDGNWSESYICNLIDWHLKEQETMPWLTGTAYWPFKDFSTPLRPDNPVPYVNQKGVVERNLEKKEAYYVFQSYWTEKPMVRIYGHTWPIRWGFANEQKQVKVYSNCDEAELFLNGVSQGVRKRNSQDFPAAGLRWNVNFNEGINTLTVSAWKDGVRVQDSLVQQYQTDVWGEPSKLLLQTVTRVDETVTVLAELVDSNGVRCLDADDYVRFSLAGPGHLLDHLGTSDGSNKVQLYNGRAMITVATGSQPCVVAVACENVQPAFLTIP
ncbi:glycoside hydrolase family 2 protein [Parapedobacter soli]|uniref:glycoside hydrolase family 2 protein n=1 Tax=Parapedobacter soli TaxID=416955 RepID=UPI0021C8C6FD|nr:glycoside hydrolase family 2 TIM barrel-domain containing protein [Parapedobacter soli]